jgi:hypothetical protein
MKPPNFEELARQALGIDKPPQSSADREEHRLLERHVRAVQVKLVMVYGLGMAQSDGKDRR